MRVPVSLPSIELAGKGLLAYPGIVQPSCMQFLL
jgi:hypothetical protein